MPLTFPITYFEEHLSGGDNWETVFVNWEDLFRNWEDMDNV